ncbi:uncharacterized protein LOC141899840 [Tubulanus polymorphus]|uniref:uncharacterized protein LOC141899840 n=1 Tax=Tubulanus polymorphus TaxID=672921 RepID=UPI003DA36305
MQLMIGAIVFVGAIFAANGAAVGSDIVKSRQKRSHMKYNTNLPPVDQAQNMIPCAEHMTEEIWYEGCQTCGCTTEKLMVCTLRDCIPMQKRRRRNVMMDSVRSLRPRNNEDTAGVRIRVPYSHCHGHLQEEVYHIGCNICKCDVGGIEYCQMKKCPRFHRGMNEVYDENYARVSESACDEVSLGKHISDGCHLCKCTSYGLVCTRNWCPTIEIDYKR